MPKPCTNGLTCVFLKTPKGCKFVHPSPSHLVEDEVRDSLKAADMDESLTSRLTTTIVRMHKPAEIYRLLSESEQFARLMIDQIEILERQDGKVYFPIFQNLV